MPSRFDAVIFDFDGVLVESVDVKTDAFAALYAEYGPDVVKRVVAYHREHGGISRFQKFRHFHREFLGLELTSKAEADLGRRFTGMVENAVVTAPWVEGARELLESRHREVPLFIASGTPEDELIRIVARRRMQQYFVSVHGSPTTKAEIIRRITATHYFERSRILMVGDSTTDYQGAVEAGVAFVARVPRANSSTFPGHVSTIPDLRSLLNSI